MVREEGPVRHRETGELDVAHVGERQRRAAILPVRAGAHREDHAAAPGGRAPAKAVEQVPERVGAHMAILGRAGRSENDNRRGRSVAVAAGRWLAAALVTALLVGIGRASASDGPRQPELLGRHPSARWRVDTATGDGALFERFCDPEIQVVERATVTPAGGALFTAWNAAQSTGSFALDPRTGSRAGVSGTVEAGSDAIRGDGPGFEPGLTALAAAPTAHLRALRLARGPMCVSIATGGRAVVSQSVPPPVGDSVPRSRPVDLAIESTGSLLVVDQDEGLVRVARADGDRRKTSPSTSFVGPPVSFHAAG